MMGYSMQKSLALTVGTSAQTVSVKSRYFMIANNSTAATVYFKEQAEDGTDAAESNSFSLPPGKVLDQVLTCDTLSLCASEAGADVRLLFLDIG